MSVAKRLIEEQLEEQADGELLKPLDSVTLGRPGLRIQVALNQPAFHQGTPPRSSATPIGVKIVFSDDDYSWLNEKEMKQLVNLLTTGNTNDFK